MRRVEILEDFDGYPEGEKRRFRAGEAPDLPDAFAGLIIAKGHARDPLKKPPAGRKPSASKGDQS